MSESRNSPAFLDDDWCQKEAGAYLRQADIPFCHPALFRRSRRLCLCCVARRLLFPWLGFYDLIDANPDLAVSDGET
jgi:hypothetical protein